ncbi:MAG: hypothetical protein WD181_04115 [Solirubrobacterales bacterium]
MALIIAFVPDLMLSSRVSGALTAAGHDVVAGAVSSAPELPSGTELVVCDLEAVDPAVIAALTVPSLGFYSHVDVETRRLALEAGVDLVVPRSRMARELPDLVAGLL